MVGRMEEITRRMAEGDRVNKIIPPEGKSMPEFDVEQALEAARQREECTEKADNRKASQEINQRGPKPAPLPPDPWADLGNFRCSSCMYFNPSRLSPAEVVNLEGIGRCRRHAPATNGYPAVYPFDWCGDHKMPKGA